MSGTLDKFKGVHCLVHVVGGRGNVAHNEGKSISSEGILKKSS